MSVSILEDPMPRVPRGDTRRFRITIVDFNKQPVDPNWVQLQLIKKGAADSPYGPFFASREEIGVYYVIWTVPPGTTLGEWIREWTWDIQVGTAHHLGAYQSSILVQDKTEKVKTFG